MQRVRTHVAMQQMLHSNLEAAWIQEILGMHKNRLSLRLAGRIRWQLEELNQVCRAINELGQDKYGPEWQEVRVDEFVEFRDVSLEEVKWPQPKQLDKAEQDETS